MNSELLLESALPAREPVASQMSPQRGYFIVRHPPKNRGRAHLIFCEGERSHSKNPEGIPAQSPKLSPTHRDYFGVAFIQNHQPQRGCGSWLLTAEHVRVRTPLGLFSRLPYRPRVVPMDRDNPGLEDAIPLGLNRTAARKMRCAPEESFAVF